MYKKALVLAILFFSFLGTLSPVVAAIFEFDPTFGTNGISDLPPVLEGNYDTPYSLIQLPDEKYLVAGNSSQASSNAVLWRLTASGALDTTFNSQGWREYDFGVHTIFHNVLLTSDGKYLACGQYGAVGDTNFFVARILANSELDASFSTDGFVSIDGDNNNDQCNDLLEDANGKYVAAGYLSTNDSYYQTTLFRFNEDGSLDTTFGDNGSSILLNSGDIFYTYASDMAMYEDKYIVVGTLGNSTSGSELMAMRYNQDGSIDSAFGISGLFRFTLEPNLFGTYGYGLALQADGKVVITGGTAEGENGSDMIIARLNSDGDLDTTFAGVGYLTFDVNTVPGDESFETGYDVAIDASGSYVVSGISNDGISEYTPTIWKITSSGEFDLSFNDTGYYTHTDPLYSQNFYNRILIGSDGKYMMNVIKFNMDFSLSAVSIFRFNNEYQVTNLPAGYEVEFEEINIEEGSSNGTYGNVLLRLLRAGVPLAEMQVDMTEDQDWSAVSGDTDSDSFKSFVHNILNVGGAGANYSLFVPKSAAHTSVGICPGATALGQVAQNCSGLQSLTSSSSNVTVVEVDGQDYWRVSGLTSTGGFSFTAAAGGSLPATGSNQTLLIVLSSSLVMLSLVVFKNNYSY